MGKVHELSEVAAIAALLTEYERFMRSWDASEATIEARTVLARARLKAWGLAGFTTANVQTFLGTPGWSRWTRATYHAHLKSLCEFMVAGGYLPDSPMEDVRKARRPQSMPRPLADAEMKLVLELADTYPDRRILDWLTMARRAGLRCHEIAKFSGEDLSERGLYVLGKGAKEAVLPVHPEIMAMSRRYPARGYWWPSPYGGHIQSGSLSAAVSKFFSDLGIEGSIHRMRHNFGTDLLRAGNNIRIVQKLMRHSNLQTTAVYTAVDEDELRDAIFTLPTLRTVDGGPDAA